MLIRKPPYLLLSLIFLFGCKKDNTTDPVVYKGTVLHFPDNIPVAGAHVTMSYIKWNNPNEIPLENVTINTETNNKGEFEFSVSDRFYMNYMFSVTKPGLIQASDGYTHSLPQNDTLYLQEPAFARLIVKIKTPLPAPDWIYFLEWAMLGNYKWTISYDSRIYSSIVTADTITSAYAPRIAREARAILHRNKQAPYITDSSIVVNDSILLDPTKTTEMLIEY